MTTPKEHQLAIKIGDHIWYSPSLISLIFHGFDTNPFLERHALGDPGAAAEDIEEIIHHMNQCSNESGRVVSAFLTDTHRGREYLCFTTDLKEDATYIYTVSPDELNEDDEEDEDED